MKELKKILCVEDEKDIQNIAKLSLEQIGGFELKLCSSGLEAIQECATYEPDLILLDIMMPEMDGGTTMKKLQELPTCKNVPVIFISAKTQKSDI